MAKETMKKPTSRKSAAHHSSASGTPSTRRKGGKKRSTKKKKKRGMIIAIEVLLILVVLIGFYVVSKLDQLQHPDMGEGDTSVNEGIEEDTVATMSGYTTVALFGLDTRESGQLGKGNRSDTIIIASINNDTGEVRLASVFRDTYLDMTTGKFNKANSAYNTGGPEEAISLLNRNFDLDIKNYVSVNFNALVKVIDALGGIDIKMTKEEAHWCNLYGAETARVIGEHWSDIEEKAGTQHLDGIHGVAYARIRYTSGNDFKRAQRQRIVLEKVAKKAQKANFITLNKIVNEVFPMISTSFSSKQILGFAANALNYNLVSTNGFPYQVTTSETVKNHSGVSFVIPIGLEQNVKQLHQELFNDDSYEASDKVKEIDSDIVYLTDITADNTEAMESTFKGDSLNEGTE